MLEIGQRLKRVREKCELTQVKVFQLTGISNKTLSGYENDVSFPDLETLTILADLYNVSTDYLLGRTTVPFTVDSYNAFQNTLVKTIISALPNCSDTNKAIIISMLDSWGALPKK